MERERLNRIVNNCIAITVIIGCLLCSLLLFKSCLISLFIAIKNMCNSFLYYFVKLFNLNVDIIPTVTLIPVKPGIEGGETALPETAQEFNEKIIQVFKLLFTLENFKLYSIFTVINFIDWLYYLIILLPLFVAFFMIIKRIINLPNNSYNRDSLPLKIYKKAVKVSYDPVKNWVNKYIEFLKTKPYLKVILIIWLVNLNAISIIIELVAYLIYFAVSLDFINLYVQFRKLYSLLNVPFKVVPWFVWGLIILAIFMKWRKKVGYNRLSRLEGLNKKYINNAPIVTMIVGTMGKKKTTVLTDIVLSKTVMFRNKAFELILENDLKFPYFPWINLENEIRRGIYYHKIYNLATCKRYIAKKKRRFLAKPCIEKCFNYDYLRYGTEYNDALKIIDLWQVLETYTQLYFIYVCQSSLLISNYSIREDNLLIDIGNFPIWNNDFFKRDSRLMESYSRHSHILDFDILRLGRKLVEDNEKNNCFEFGVVVITEAAKERGNQLDTQGMKKDDLNANQKNDLFNLWLKMARHSATVDYYPFVSVYMDDQRPESMGADVRDLCEIIHICDTEPMKLAMPGFFIEEFVHDLVFNKFINSYVEYRHLRGDNTLSMYLLKNISARLHGYYTRINNTFSYMRVRVQNEDGTMTGGVEEHKYYLMPKKIYSNRFSTDCFSDYFHSRSLESLFGISDLKTYDTIKATIEELKEQNSYFITDLLSAYDELTKNIESDKLAKKIVSSKSLLDKVLSIMELYDLKDKISKKFITNNEFKETVNRKLGN